MGKRAAAKPKADAKPSQAKKSKTSAVAAAPLPSAPPHWGRPPPRVLCPASDALCFFLVDIEDACAYGELGDELRLYGVTAEGASISARLFGVAPYFYVPCPPECQDSEENIQRFQTALESSLPSDLRRPGRQLVVKVEKVKRTPVLVFQPEGDFLCIKVAGTKCMTPCVKALEQGIRVPATDAHAAFEVQSGSTFEANIALALRFLVDADLGGGRWVELAAGAYSLNTETKCTSAQLEVDVAMNVDTAPLRAISLDTDAGSAIPPVRTVAIEVLVDAESHISAAACVLSVQGQTQRLARGVWFRRGADTGDTVEPDAGKMEVDNNGPEPAKVFVSSSEEALVEHFGKTVELFDADIVLTYDLTGTLRPFLDKKGVVRPGSAVARGFCRRLTTELKITKNSNEVSGFAGRLGFDLQKQVEKEHRLTDYSLGNLSETFCQVPLPELSAATLAQLSVARPCAFVQYALSQAEATLRIFDHLAYLYNFVEMARVTGCPLGYLLDRGQAVKVQAQLLSEARSRKFVLPSQRPSTGEDNTFEGATVLEPVTGFHRSPIAVLDFASLYPSIMMAHNLCYSTLLGEGAEKRAGVPAHSVAPDTAVSTENGTHACFVQPSVRKGLLPSILERILAARKHARKQLADCAGNSPETQTLRKVLHGRQLALKLSANSVYGFTGAMNGPLPCLELAGAVTAYGREMIQATKRKVESHFVESNGFRSNAEVIYGDTDSVMVRFGPDDLSLDEAIKLSTTAAEICSAEFPDPAHLEFEKVYWPYLLMAKKRYAGLAHTSPQCKPKLDTKGIETVRRDWSDLVRQGLEQTLQLLLKPEGADGVADATTYVRNLCDEVRQNKIDFRALIISKSLGRDDYASKLPHVTVAEKLRKRDPTTAPRTGDRVPYLVLAGAAKSAVNTRAEDPLYALEHELPIDADYYLENQLKQPLMRVFELVYGSAEKAEHALFAASQGDKKLVAGAAVSSLGGLGKFMKARPKCLDCNGTAAKDGECFCEACAAKGPDRLRAVTESCVKRAKDLQAQLDSLHSSCQQKCALSSTIFIGLPPDDKAAETPLVTDGRERCSNLNCQSIFKRVRVARELTGAVDALTRLKVTDR